MNSKSGDPRKQREAVNAASMLVLAISKREVQQVEMSFAKLKDLDEVGNFTALLTFVTKYFGPGSSAIDDSMIAELRMVLVGNPLQSLLGPQP